ncbi:MAG: hypothetical protein ACJAZ3_001376 [Sphingobacteriales bacterium]|jgi:hypothetical protein
MYFIQYGRKLFAISKIGQARGIKDVRVSKMFAEYPELKEELRKEVIKFRTYKIMFYVFLVLALLFKGAVYFW